MIVLSVWSSVEVSNYLVEKNPGGMLSRYPMRDTVTFNNTIRDYSTVTREANEGIILGGNTNEIFYIIATITRGFGKWHQVFGYGVINIYNNTLWLRMMVL
jgi:hypothetical protein